jgi:hypothetical protein
MAAACAAMIVGGASAQNAVQWRVRDGGNGHWYRLRASTGSIPWTTAKSEAESEGGHLATITSHPENLWVFQNIAPGPTGWDCGGDCYGPWLGGFQDTAAAEYVEPAGGWRWVTGEPWVYSAWAPGLPNNAGVQNWLHLYGAPELEGPFNPGPRWDDVEFNWHQVRSYIVEWSADCNGDGIVDYGQIRDGSLPDYNGNNIPDCCEQGTPCAVGSYPVQWRVEDGGNGHWYAIRSSGLPPFNAGNWEALRTLAIALGGQLAEVETSAENLLVRRVLDSVAGGGEAWAYLGATHDGTGSCSSTTWRWLSGSALSFVNWAPGQPNCIYTNGVLDEPRLAIRSVSGAWGDWSAVELNRGIIEWSADCNGDGIVDYGQILTGQLADANSNGIPDTCEIDPCPGDITNNGVVNGTDLAAILAAWGSDGSNKFDCDIDNDGSVGGGDLAFVLAGWGACP